MKPLQFVLPPLVKLFERVQAVTMPEMKAALRSPVDRTVFRKLEGLDYFTSYSHRGAFYTLKSIAVFDSQGLWSARGAWFSRHGTLLDTAEAWINDSAGGYFTAELEQSLHLPLKDALRRLAQSERVKRQDFHGLHLYTAKDRIRRQEQLAARQAKWESPAEEEDSVRAAIALFYSLLDEQQRRLYAGLESFKRGHGGDRKMAQVLGLDAETVAKGRRELLTGQIQRERIRRPGGGRPRAEKKHPIS
jgi:hypothetical protein